MSRDWVFVHEAVTTEDLRRVACVVDRDCRRVELCDCSLTLERLARCHPRSCVVVGEPGDVRAHLHVGNPERDRLEATDRLAESLALLRITHRLVNTRLCKPDGKSADRDPPFVERRQ